MKKAVIQMRDTENIYTLDKVNCFERPTAIVLEHMNSCYSSFYLMFRKYFYSYMQDFNDYFIFDMLGLKYVKKDSTNDIGTIIYECINTQKPVLIPGNLKELYYSDHYKTQNWPHLFLVNGYDFDNNLYRIFDATQVKGLNGKQVYMDFTVRSEDIESVYKSYTYTYGNSNAYISYFENINNSIDKKELLNKFFVMMSNKDKTKYLEHSKCTELASTLLECVDIKRATNIVNSMMPFLINSTKSKIVMIDEMLRLLRSFSLTLEEVEEINFLKKNTSDAWSQLISKFIKEIHKNLYNNMLKVPSICMEKALFYENKLCELATRYMAKTSSLREEIQNTWEYKDFVVTCQNNNDGVIKIHENDVTFQFHDKIYNSWFSDESPKLVILNTNIFENCFSFSVNLDTCFPNAVEGFLAGIFIRTKGGDLFIWGYDNNNCYLLELVGKDKIYSRYTDQTNHNFIVKIENNELCYGIIEGSKVTFLESMCLDDTVSEIGLVCKTWSECKFGKIVFSDLEIAIL